MLNAFGSLQWNSKFFLMTEQRRWYNWLCLYVSTTSIWQSFAQRPLDSAGLPHATPLKRKINKKNAKIWSMYNTIIDWWSEGSYMSFFCRWDQIINQNWDLLRINFPTLSPLTMSLNRNQSVNCYNWPTQLSGTTVLPKKKKKNSTYHLGKKKKLLRIF